MRHAQRGRGAQIQTLSGLAVAVWRAVCPCLSLRVLPRAGGRMSGMAPCMSVFNSYLQILPAIETMFLQLVAAALCALAALCLLMWLRKHRLPRRARRHAILTSKSFLQFLPPNLFRNSYPQFLPAILTCYSYLQFLPIPTYVMRALCPCLSSGCGQGRRAECWARRTARGLSTAEPAVAGDWKSLPLPHAVAEGGEQRVGRGALHAGHWFKKGRQVAGARACTAGKSPATGRVIATKDLGPTEAMTCKDGYLEIGDNMVKLMSCQASPRIETD